MLLLGWTSNVLSAPTFDEGEAAFQMANTSRKAEHPGYAKAYRIWSRFAKAGDPASLYHLGVLHLYGLGGASFDQARGFQLIRQSAESGYPKAEGYLGVMYEKGNGLYVRIDPVEAGRWYEKAARGGHCYSVRRLARATARGELGLPLDPARAKEIETARPRCFPRSRDGSRGKEEGE